MIFTFFLGEKEGSYNILLEGCILGSIFHWKYLMDGGPESLLWSSLSSSTLLSLHCTLWPLCPISILTLIVLSMAFFRSLSILSHELYLSTSHRSNNFCIDDSENKVYNFSLGFRSEYFFLICLLDSWEVESSPLSHILYFINLKYNLSSILFSWYLIFSFLLFSSS